MKSADFSGTGELAEIKASQEGEQKKEQIVQSWREPGLLLILPTARATQKGSS